MLKYLLLNILILIISRCIYVTNRRNMNVGVMTGVLFSFLVYYCFIPILILYNYPKIENKTGFITSVYESSIESFFCFLCVYYYC